MVELAFVTFVAANTCGSLKVYTFSQNDSLTTFSKEYGAVTTPIHICVGKQPLDPSQPNSF